MEASDREEKEREKQDNITGERELENGRKNEKIDRRHNQSKRAIIIGSALRSTDRFYVGLWSLHFVLVALTVASLLIEVDNSLSQVAMNYAIRRMLFCSLNEQFLHPIFPNMCHLTGRKG